MASTRIREPKKPFNLVITKDHVKEACDQDGFCTTDSCAIAVALKYALKHNGEEIFNISIGPSRTSFMVKGKVGKQLSVIEYRYQTPSKLRTMLSKWDTTHDNSVFTAGMYELQPLPASSRQKYRADNRGKRTEPEKPRRKIVQPTFSPRIYNMNEKFNQAKEATQ